MKQRLQFSTADPYLFVRRRNGKKLIFAMYVNDGLIVVKESEIDVSIVQLLHNFKIATGTLNSFLSMHIEQRQN
jgi:phage antirepressor YoqD-like protein